jgi:hypothetical protein
MMKPIPWFKLVVGGYGGRAHCSRACLSPDGVEEEPGSATRLQWIRLANDSGRPKQSRLFGTE